METLKGHILYTEDDPDSRDLMQFLFTQSGYEIMCADNGPEALQLAKHEQFDIFLIDNWMPDLTGVELTRCIREFNQTTPILFFSGAAHEAARQAALDAGAQGYVTKPPDIDLLLNEVARLIRQIQT